MPSLLTPPRPVKDPDIIWDHLQRRYELYAQHVTQIYNRPDLHMAMDLCFHSPLHFYFNAEYVHHGWLDVLVIGDTRCGKGRVAEGLARYYRAGEVISGENSSFVGIVGGAPKIGERTFITWGMLVLNTGRLVIIDEMAEIHPNDLGRMSRVRSEGIAELSKGGYHHKTKAETRIIWLSNTRSRRFLRTYSNGAEAIMELCDNKTEDIARFTYAIGVAQGEVASSIINARRTPSTAESPLNPELDRWRVMWAWSRRADQVKFSKDAARLVLKYTEQLGKKLTPEVPLFQVESGRFKIASIAAAIAASCMSTDELMQNLKVYSGHVTCAKRMLVEFYEKECMSYIQYSASMREQSTMKDEEAVSQLLDSLGKAKQDFISGILEMRNITVTAVAAHTHMDKHFAKEFIQQLIGLRAMQQEYTYYVKRPAFIAFLRRERAASHRN